MVRYVGIVNITPDSFSDGGEFFAAESAIRHAHELIAAGADIIDLGAQSTRPKATLLTADEEWQRLEPVLAGLKATDIAVSIDTFYPSVITRALDYFPDLIINDVTTAHDPEMRRLIAESGLRVFLSHLPFSVNGDIQAAHQLEPLIDDSGVVKQELLARRSELIAMGASPEQIILDPGIGFGKTMRLSAELIEFAREVPDIPVLIGASRKRFIEQHLHQDRFDAQINADLGRKAVAAGAAYLRVHEIPRPKS